MKNISVLGSTGSIGTQTLDVANNDEEINICGLAAKSNVDLLEKQIRKFRPDIACIVDEDKFLDLSNRISDLNTKVVSGSDGLLEVCANKNTDTVLNSVVGIAGLIPTICAISEKKNVLLANKETLVCAGEIVMGLAKEKNVNIIPVDSEHSAIFQCINGEEHKSLKKIILTASGGPFFGKTKDELKFVTKKDALKHPNWNMGAKITIDSATLMNKGLEVIEAKWLFDVDAQFVMPIIHRESVIHSMVEFEDNSIIAQLGAPDMRLPISYAINYPSRKKSIANELDFDKISNLTFKKPDYETFKCLKLATDAIQKGGNYPAVLNGANEAAVELFLQDKIMFLDIADLVEQALMSYKGDNVSTINNILDADRFARDFVFKKGRKIC